MLYYTQTFTGDGNKEIHAYGKMDAHNHDQANQFGKDIVDYLSGKGWENAKGKNFKSNQPEPKDGKLFKWVATSAKNGQWKKA